jgi:sugar O-acyltransferase (sialic acid O-acetyltransferase NeuD family)
MPKSVRLAIVGAGDLGRTLYRQLKDVPGYEVTGFFDDTCVGSIIHDTPVLGSIRDLLTGSHVEQYDQVAMAIGYRHLDARAELYDKLLSANVRFATIIHPSAFIASGATIGVGTIISAGCVLDTGVVVAANCLVNIGCVIAHDSKIGSHTFLGPSVNIAGFVTVGERCFLGIGTTVIDNIRLGDGSQTAGGAVVISDVSTGVMVAGVPAVEKKRIRQ